MLITCRCHFWRPAVLEGWDLQVHFTGNHKSDTKWNHVKMNIHTIVLDAIFGSLSDEDPCWKNPQKGTGRLGSVPAVVYSNDLDGGSSTSHWVRWSDVQMVHPPLGLSKQKIKYSKKNNHLNSGKEQYNFQHYPNDPRSWLFSVMLPDIQMQLDRGFSEISSKWTCLPSLPLFQGDPKKPIKKPKAQPAGWDYVRDGWQDRKQEHKHRNQ